MNDRRKIIRDVVEQAHDDWQCWSPDELYPDLKPGQRVSVFDLMADRVVEALGAAEHDQVAGAQTSDPERTT